MSMRRNEGSGKKIRKQNMRDGKKSCLWIGVRKRWAKNQYHYHGTSIPHSRPSNRNRISVVCSLLVSSLPVRPTQRFHISFGSEHFSSINFHSAEASCSVTSTPNSCFVYMWVWVSVCMEKFRRHKTNNNSGSSGSSCWMEWKIRAEVFAGQKKEKFGKREKRRRQRDNQRSTKNEDNATFSLYITIFYVVYYLKRMTAQTSSLDGIFFCFFFFFFGIVVDVVLERTCVHRSQMDSRTDKSLLHQHWK